MLKNLARLGVRSGGRIRKNISIIREQRLMEHVCPVCKKKTIRRKSTALWECRACQFQIAKEANVF